VTGISVLVTTTIIGVVVRYSVAVAVSVGVVRMVGGEVGVGAARFTSNGELNNAAMIVAAEPISAMAMALFILRDFGAFPVRRAFLRGGLSPILITFPLPLTMRLSEMFLPIFISECSSDGFSGVWLSMVCPPFD
jgi:hypothetical protein